MVRRCARPDCHNEATSTLGYDYKASTVWLEALSAESHPMTHDLCARHSDRMSVPQGWTLRDTRAGAALRYLGNAIAS